MADEANAAAVARGKKDKKGNSQRKNRGVHWPNEATEVLIDLWAEETIQFALENAKSSKEIRAVYQNLKVRFKLNLVQLMNTDVLSFAWLGNDFLAWSFPHKR